MIGINELNKFELHWPHDIIVNHLRTNIDNHERHVYWNTLFYYIHAFISIFRSEERQYCWNCSSRLNPRCGRRLSRQLARSVSVPPTRNVHQSVPCIRSKSMPYRKKDTSKMPTSECIVQPTNNFKSTVHNERIIFLLYNFINLFVFIF